MRSLSERQSRHLAAGLLISCLVMVALLVYIPVRMLHRHYDGAIANRTDLIARYQHIIATSAEIRTALDHAKKNEGRKHFLRNTGAALAASEIQETAKNLIETNGGKLISMQVVPFKDEGAYRRVTINIQLSSNMTTLRKILYAVETMQPYLLVDNVNVRSLVNALYKNASGMEPEMTVRFDLTGYALMVDGK